MQKIIIGDKLIAKNSYREYIVKGIRVRNGNKEYCSVPECYVDFGESFAYHENKYIYFVFDNDSICGMPYLFYPKLSPIKVICKK